MTKNKVWQKGGLEHQPPNRKGINAKLVFNKKRNGIFRARNVVHSEENHADIFTKNLNIETFAEHYNAMGLEDENQTVTPKMRNRKGLEVEGFVFPP